MKRNLRVYERDHIYPQSLSYYLELIRLSPNKYPYLANYWEVMAYNDDYFWWARDTAFLEKAARKWLRTWLSSSQNREKIINWFKRDYRLLRTTIIPLKYKDVKKLSNIDLFKLYRKSLDFALRYLEYAEYTVDLFDDYFAKLFTEYLLGKNKNIFSSEISDFFHPVTASVGSGYRKEILELSLSNKINLKVVDDLAKKYSWIKMSWDGTGELTIKDVMSDIRKTLKIKKAKRQQEIRSIANYPKKVLEKRKKLINKYKLNKREVKTYFLLLDQFNVFHDYRKKIQMQCNQVIYRVLNEASVRFDLAFSDLIFYMNKEIEDLLLKNKKVDGRIIAERQEGITWLIVKGRIFEYLGKEAGKKLNELVLSSSKAHKVKEIKGLPASKGMIKGTVYIAKRAKKANQFLEKGKILVTSMTTIDYLPAMERAAAIITDDGGATCHAAIVSRELNIPCIVGTKIATKVLKDGDLVEVDANKGTVRIIKK